MTQLNSLSSQKEALLKELSSLRRIVCGSFFVRNLNGKPRHCLSRMREGKQRQVYIAQPHAEAVALGVGEYARALEILSELGQINLLLIQQGVDHE